LDPRHLRSLFRLSPCFFFLTLFAPIPSELLKCRSSLSGYSRTSNSLLIITSFGHPPFPPLIGIAQVTFNSPWIFRFTGSPRLLNGRGFVHLAAIPALFPWIVPCEVLTLPLLFLASSSGGVLCLPRFPFGPRPSFQLLRTSFLPPLVVCVMVFFFFFFYWSESPSAGAGRSGLFHWFFSPHRLGPFLISPPGGCFFNFWVETDPPSFPHGFCLTFLPIGCKFSCFQPPLFFCLFSISAITPRSSPSWCRPNSFLFFTRYPGGCAKYRGPKDLPPRPEGPFS